MAVWPTTNVLGLALLTIFSCGASTVLVVVPLQWLTPAAGQLGSPPPLAAAVFATLVPLVLACGVIGIVNTTLPPTRMPAGKVQVTVWPLALQPPGKVPMVNPVGIVSLMVPAREVAWPVLVAVIR